MTFEFVKFPGIGRGFSARASVRKNGQIGFNNGAVMHFRLRDYNAVVLHYDATSAVIGVEVASEERDASACRLVHRPGNSYVAAKSFFDYFQIPLRGETRRFELRHDDETGMLIIELGKPLGKRVSERP